MFDTLKYTKEAVAAGFSQQQAEFQAEKMAELVNDTLVTKDYLKNELTHMEHRILRFVNKTGWIIVTGIPTILFVVSSLYHMVWK